MSCHCHPSMFYLRVHQHVTKTVHFPQHETLTTLLDRAIQDCQKLNGEILQRKDAVWNLANGGGVHGHVQSKNSGASKGEDQHQVPTRRRSLSTAQRRQILPAEVAKCTAHLSLLTEHVKFLRHMMITIRKHPVMDSNADLATHSKRDLAYHREACQDEKNRLEYDGPVNTIATFNYEYRGLLLFLIHTLDKLTHRFLELDSEHKKKSGKLFFSKDMYIRQLSGLVKECGDKLDVILVLTKVAVAIVENRYLYLEHYASLLQRQTTEPRDSTDGASTTSNGNDGPNVPNITEDSSLKGHRVLSPFMDGMKFSDFKEIKEFDFSVFMEEMGTQYMPMVGTYFNILVRVTAGHNITSKLKNDFVRQGLLGLSQILYAVDKKKLASREIVKFFREASPEHSRMLWESLDTGIIKFFNYLTLPPIQTSRLFFVGGPIPSTLHLSPVCMSRQEYVECMHQPQECILRQTPFNSMERPKRGTHQAAMSYDVTTLQDLNFLDANPTLTQVARGDVIQDTTSNDQHQHVESDSGLLFEGNIGMKDFELQSKKMPRLLAQQRTEGHLDVRMENIQLRLVSSWEIKDKDTKIRTVEDWGLLSKLSRTTAIVGKKLYLKNKEKLHITRDGCMILHIHGGGFVSMSSYSHESYVRRWAYRCNVPIISVDYRKAPGYKYPSLVAECYEAYKWILQNAEHILGQPLKKVIIAGDSAGGNLTMAVCNRAIRDKIRIPDALVLSYPLTLLKGLPSPARIMSLMDPLVNFNFLRMCCQSYIGDSLEYNEIRKNAYMSPAVTPPEILAQYPPTYVHVGSLDPLFDDAVYVAKRIEKYNGGRVTLEVYDGLPHAYLNMVGLVPGATAANKNLMSWMNNFFDDTEMCDPSTTSMSDSDGEHMEADDEPFEE